jgi:hypothetical protein
MTFSGMPALSELELHPALMTVAAWEVVAPQHQAVAMAVVVAEYPVPAAAWAAEWQGLEHELQFHRQP